MKKNLITIGLKGFPYGNAAVQKLKMMGMALVEDGDEFLIISNEYVYKTKFNKNLKREGTVKGIKYYSTSPQIFAPNSSLSRIICQISGKFKELIYVFRLCKLKQIDAVIIYSSSFLYSAFWALLLRILKRPTFLIYFEFRSKVTSRRKWNLRLNDLLFDRFIFYFFSGFITISEFLSSHIKKFVPNKPLISIPPIVDFKEYDLKLAKPKESYFLFCGSLAYVDVIEFIVKSYKSINESRVKLYLVISGSLNNKIRIKNLINELELDDQVAIFEFVSDEKLKELYINAKALLIPLRNTSQDIARFPHKIAEYCAAKRPIVTTKIGEIVNFFDDNSAIMASGYDIKLYAEKLKYVIENPEKCESIAENSYNLGKLKFNYSFYSKPLKKMMFNVD